MDDLRWLALQNCANRVNALVHDDNHMLVECDEMGQWSIVSLRGHRINLGDWDRAEAIMKMSVKFAEQDATVHTPATTSGADGLRQPLPGARSGVQGDVILAAPPNETEDDR